MNLQLKILTPIFIILALALFAMGMISVTTANRTVESVLESMDEKNISLAQSLAYIIAQDQSNLETAKMHQLADMLGVEEVHVVDADGILQWGNVEGFYGFDFRDGDQTAPLLSILTNPIPIAQEPQPRGVDNVMFQYISVPRIDETGIVQVGVSMETIGEIERLGRDALINTIAFGAPAFAIIVILTAFIVRWIVRKTQWYENILDCIPFPVSITDNNRNWTFINKAVEDFIGKKRSEVIGQQCYNWGTGICKTSNCGVECLGRGQSSTEFHQMGMDFKVDSAYLTDIKKRRTGHIEVVQDISEMRAMQREEEKLVAEIEKTSDSFVATSKQIANGSQSLAQGSTQQAASIQELSSSISEIAGKTKENAEMASRAATLANTIMGNAEKGSTQMDEMMTAVKDINQASQQISKVIKVIDDIAFQTNILALNAAVEAARAGQHGKGFAVVAEEVRSLASKSAEAAKETGNLIANSTEKADLGSRIAENTALSLNEIVQGINESSQLISQIAQSSDEQSAGIEQVNKGIDQVAQVISQTSATAQQSAAASHEMSEQSEMLAGLLEQFRKSSANTEQKALPSA